MFLRQHGSIPLCIITKVSRECSPSFSGWHWKQTACCFRRASQIVRRYSKIHVERDVRYSSHHPRNVLDIYSPINATSNDDDKIVRPTLLFVHGGMWLRGSKEQQMLSVYDAISHVTSQIYQTLWQESKSHDESITSVDKQYSNLGVCLAQHGGIACIMNYRLAGSNSDNTSETGHPHQVMDVARAIAFLISRSLAENIPLQLYIGGHSAGAHLAALVLSDLQYLHMAMKEKELDYDLIRDALRGFIGISGVYNLRRLAMSPLAAVTIGPAFRGKQDCDVTLDASPVQMLLRAHEMEQKCGRQKKDGLPPLVTIPILLLNAQSDFHLAQDAAELLTASNHFADSLPTTSEPLKRQSIVVTSRNHLSIMGEFGRGLIEGNIMTTEEIADEQSWWTTTNTLHKSRDAFSILSAYLSPYVSRDSQKEVQVDEVAASVLGFMSLSR